jgi:hypothetical protein
MVRCLGNASEGTWGTAKLDCHARSSRWRFPGPVAGRIALCPGRVVPSIGLLSAGISREDDLAALHADALPAWVAGAVIVGVPDRDPGTKGSIAVAVKPGT